MTVRQCYDKAYYDGHFLQTNIVALFIRLHSLDWMFTRLPVKQQTREISICLNQASTKPVTN